MTLRARSWSHTHSFDHAQFPARRLADERRATVSVCLPARDEERTIGAIIRSLIPLRDCGVIDQIAVVDASRDATGAIAGQLGVEVRDQRTPMPELGPGHCSTSSTRSWPRSASRRPARWRRGASCCARCRS